MSAPARPVRGRPGAPVALVTGASGDFGRAIATELDRLGCQVVVHYNRSEASAKELAASLHNPSMVVGGDISSWEQVTEMYARITAELGPVDVVVNNGALRKDSLMAMQSPTDWQEVIDTNLVGTFHVSRVCLPHMLTQRWGRIINIVSPSGIIATAGQTAYSASKAGVIGMTRTLALECARRGVTVNALSPGFMITGMTEGLSDAVKDGIKSKCPMGRFGTTTEVASSMGFLLDADYMTGQVISIDGGVTIT